jgi:cell division GTPase FtsZ
MSFNILDVVSSGFVPNINTYSYATTTVIVVGCGGTGGRLIPQLAQHISNHNADVKRIVNQDNAPFLKHEIGLLLVDMDVVNF